MENLIRFKELLREQHIPLIIVAVGDLDVYGVDRLMQLAASDCCCFSSLSDDLEENLDKLNANYIGGRLDFSKPVFLIALIEQEAHREPLLEMSDMLVTLDNSAFSVAKNTINPNENSSIRTNAPHIIFDEIRKTFNKGIWS